MQAGPTHFAFGGQAFAVIGGDFGGFFEGGCDVLDVGVRILKEFSHAELCRVDTDHAVLARAVFIENFRNAAGHLHRIEEFTALSGIAHRGVPDCARPNGSDQRADVESFADNEIGDAFQFIVSGLGIGVRQEQKIIDAVELLTVHLGGGGEVEHVLEADRGFLAFVVALADEPGPHGIV